ncbi:predicted protein [Histoplasma capsulatum H143]|uniref:Uncharacterized protein n=1 Tax=Ajellomyces capsulatus (strain H143) TaxID=544712 RepID=C6HSN9_AJECH|nr:predicted protein [Histoplasma capsulatum H143]
MAASGPFIFSSISCGTSNVGSAIHAGDSGSSAFPGPSASIVAVVACPTTTTITSTAATHISTLSISISIAIVVPVPVPLTISIAIVTSTTTTPSAAFLIAWRWWGRRWRWQRGKVRITDTVVALLGPLFTFSLVPPPGSGDRLSHWASHFPLHLYDWSRAPGPDLGIAGPCLFGVLSHGPVHDLFPDLEYEYHWSDEGIVVTLLPPSL